jgi:hypothetical protein
MPCPTELSPRHQLCAASPRPIPPRRYPLRPLTAFPCRHVPMAPFCRWRDLEVLFQCRVRCRPRCCHLEPLDAPMGLFPSMQRSRGTCAAPGPEGPGWLSQTVLAPGGAGTVRSAVRAAGSCNSWFLRRSEELRARQVMSHPASLDRETVAVGVLVARGSCARACRGGPSFTSRGLLSDRPKWIVVSPGWVASGHLPKPVSFRFPGWGPRRAACRSRSFFALPGVGRFRAPAEACVLPFPGVGRFRSPAEAGVLPFPGVGSAPSCLPKPVALCFARGGVRDGLRAEACAPPLHPVGSAPGCEPKLASRCVARGVRVGSWSPRSSCRPEPAVGTSRPGARAFLHASAGGRSRWSGSGGDHHCLVG